MTRMTGPDCVVMCNLINTYIQPNTVLPCRGQDDHKYFFVYKTTVNDILKGSRCCKVYSKLPSGIEAAHQDNKPILRGGSLTFIDMLATSPAFSWPHVEVA